MMVASVCIGIWHWAVFAALQSGGSNLFNVVLCSPSKAQQHIACLCIGECWLDDDCAGTGKLAAAEVTTTERSLKKASEIKKKKNSMWVQWTLFL